MNPIKYSIDMMLRIGIPKAILNVAFLSRLMSPREANLFTLAAKLREEIIDNRVLIDINLVAATMMTIPLRMCERLESDYYNSVWRVPKELTQGKAIISVDELIAASANVMTIDGGYGQNSPGVYTPTMAGYGSVGAVAGAAQQMFNSSMPVPNMMNALCYLVGENVIMVKDIVIVPTSMFFRVFVENDSNLNHIQPAYYTTFYELVLLATKAHIYNNVVIEQDNAFIASGGELNRFREIVDTYSDAAEAYIEKLDEWACCAITNDPESQRQFYQLGIGGGH